MPESLARSEATGTKPQKRYSPLSVISLFFGLVEIGLAYSSGVSSGAVQIAVLAFMGFFAIAIASTFFVFLWYRNWVFYPPSEFANASVDRFVAAMQQPNASISKMATDEISRAFAEDTLLKRLEASEVSEEQRGLIGALVSELRKEAIENVAASVLNLDARPLKGANAPVWEEPYDENLTVSRLLDRVWLNIQPFGPYGYGTAWLLKDSSSGKLFLDIGPAYRAVAGTTQAKDERTAWQVGITGGMTLEVVPPP